MIRITDRVTLHKPEKVAGNLDDALRIATEAGLNHAERTALLPVLLTLLAAEHVVMEQTAIGAAGLGGLVRGQH